MSQKIVSLAAHMFHGLQSAYAIQWSASRKEKNGEVTFDEMLEQLKRVIGKDKERPASLYLVRGHRAGSPHYVYAYPLRGLSGAVRLFSRKVMADIRELHLKDSGICFLQVAFEKNPEVEPEVVRIDIGTLAASILSAALERPILDTPDKGKKVRADDVRETLLFESSVAVMATTGLCEPSCRLLEKKLTQEK